MKSLKGLSLSEITEIISERNEKSYRACQIYQWLYQKNARSFNEMTNIPSSIREKLSTEFSLSTLTIKERLKSNIDQAEKFLFELNDGLLIESVYMVEGRRATICLSTQVGCPIKCRYCATGLMGFFRNLTTGEIIDQFLTINSLSDKPATNVVFMGMGEPFLNYDNSIKAAKILNSELGPGIGARRITISTCGITDLIYRYADEGHKYKLAVSLNASSDEQRSALIPLLGSKANLSKKLNSIKQILDASLYFTKKSGRRVTFEYVLIDGFNDSIEDARRLAKLLIPIPCKLNIIPYNENRYLKFRTPSEEKLNRFIEEIYKAPFPVTVRRSKGPDISAACGQLFVDEAV